VADLDVRLLRAFVAVAEELSFSRAAARLDVAQQGLSAQIRQLESRLDARVFKRTTRRVALTAAGRALLPHARAALSEIEAGAAAVREAEQSAASQLAVGGLPDAGALGEAIVERFEQARPDVELVPSDLAPPQDVLDEGAGPPAAVAFVRPPFRGVNRLSTLPLASEPRLVALSDNHRLAGRDSVDAAELMDETWVWVGAGDRVAEAFWLLEDHRSGKAPRIGGKPADWAELIDLVARNRAIGLVPETVATASTRKGVQFAAVPGIEPSQLALAWRPAAETPAMRELAAIAREVAEGGAAPVT
jgi:DNA-binding transcriptional LysR family regulator